MVPPNEFGPELPRGHSPVLDEIIHFDPSIRTKAGLAGLVIILRPGMAGFGPAIQRREQGLGAVGIGVIGKPDPSAVPSGGGVPPPNAERDIPPPVSVHGVWRRSESNRAIGPHPLTSPDYLARILREIGPGFTPPSRRSWPGPSGAATSGASASRPHSRGPSRLLPTGDRSPSTRDSRLVRRTGFRAARRRDKTCSGRELARFGRIDRRRLSSFGVVGPMRAGSHQRARFQPQSVRRPDAIFIIPGVALAA
jgi:hypothetical protein